MVYSLPYRSQKGQNCKTGVKNNCSVNREPRILLIKNICNQPPKWVIKHVTECGAGKRKKCHKSTYFLKIKTLYGEICYSPDKS